MTPFETSNRFACAALNLKIAGRLLDTIAKKNPQVWARFQGRLAEAGAENVELIAQECELIATLLDAADEIQIAAAE